MNERRCRQCGETFAVLGRARNQQYCTPECFAINRQRSGMVRRHKYNVTTRRLRPPSPEERAAKSAYDKAHWKERDIRVRFAIASNALMARRGEDARIDWRELPIGPCVYCGGEQSGYDHVLPLSRGGKHEIANLVPCCLPCNVVKRHRTPEEWRAGKRVAYRKAA